MEPLNHALSLARSIKNEILRSATLAKIACITDNDEILNEAIDVAKRLDLLHYSEALSKVVIELAKVKKFDYAVKLAYDVVEERFRLEALEVISSLLSDDNRFDEAFEIAKKLKYRSQRALSDLAVKLAKSDVKRAEKVVENITDKSWKAETLAKIASLSLKNQLFDVALKITNNIEDKAIKSRVLLKIAVEMAKAGVEFEKVLKEGLMLEKNDTELLNVSVNLAEVGNVQAALKVVELINKKHVKAEALARIANISDINLFEKALKVAKSIKDKQIYLDTILSIVVEIAKSGLDYNSLLNEVIEKLQYLDDFEKSKILTVFIAEIVDIDVKKAIELSSDVVDEVYMSEALFYITKKLADIKEFNSALEIANKIVEDYWRSRALGEIAVKISSLTI